MAHDRVRERFHASTQHDVTCRVVISADGLGRFDATGSMVDLCHDLARL